MWETVVIVLSMIFFLLAFASMGMAGYHFLGMMNGIKPDKKIAVNLTAPFFLIVPAFFSERGNFHRLRFVLYMVLFIGIVGILFALQSFL